MDTREDLKQAIITHLKDKILWAVCNKQQIYEKVREWVPCTSMNIEESEDKLTDRITIHFASEVVQLDFLYHDKAVIPGGMIKNYHLYKIA